MVVFFSCLDELRFGGDLRCCGDVNCGGDLNDEGVEWESWFWKVLAGALVTVAYC